jgi:predicted transcriptional regulator
MFPSEMVILMAIAVDKDDGKKLLTRPMDVAGEYIGYLYDSLVRRGYIKNGRFRGYQLTSKGTEALMEFLHENKARAEDTIKRLQQLGIESSQKMDRLVKGQSR